MAGDLREIDMTKATSMDGKKIRLVGDDGKGYWMEKEDLASVVGELIGTATKDKNGLMPASMAKLEGFQDNVSSGKFIKIVNRNPLAYSRSLIRVNVCPSNNFGNEGVFSAVIMASNETGEQKYRAITTGDTSMAVLYYNEEGLFLKNNYKYSASVFIELAAKSRDELVGEILSVEPSSIIEL